MKRNRFFTAGILAAALVFGMMVLGCPTDSGDGDPVSPGPVVPPSSGANDLSGKTFFDNSSKIVFAATGEGAANGTYSYFEAKRASSGGSYELEGGKYIWVEMKTGIYAWDDAAKTVTLGPEKIAERDNNEYSALMTRVQYRAYIQTMLNEYIAELSEEEILSELAQMGFSSVAAYIDSEVADAFQTVKNNYAFSTDGNALFLDEPLPANKGANELSGQTYNGVNWSNDQPVTDTTRTYVFTATDCIYTRTGNSPITYDYAYDSTAKRVYLKPPVTDRETEYTSQSSNTSNSGNFNSADEYNAAMTNSQYRSEEFEYDLAAKLLMK